MPAADPLSTLHRTPKRSLRRSKRRPLRPPRAPQAAQVTVPAVLRRSGPGMPTLRAPILRAPTLRAPTLRAPRRPRDLRSLKVQCFSTQKSICPCFSTLGRIRPPSCPTRWNPPLRRRLEHHRRSSPQPTHRDVPRRPQSRPDGVRFQLPSPPVGDLRHAPGDRRPRRTRPSPRRSLQPATAPETRRRGFRSIGGPLPARVRTVATRWRSP